MSDLQHQIEAAEAYQQLFVPALFNQWAPRVIEAAGVSTGDRVLDVACGTGENFPFFRPEDDITAVDLSPGMLSIARERANRLGLKINYQVMISAPLNYNRCCAFFIFYSFI